MRESVLPNSQPDDRRIALAHRFFDAIEAGKSALVASLASEDCTIWHNYDGREKPFSEMIPKLAAFRLSLATLAYQDRDYAPLPTGVLALHLLRGRRADGPDAAVPVAVRLTIADGRITRIDEYVDPAALTPLVAPQP